AAPTTSSAARSPWRRASTPSRCRTCSTPATPTPSGSSPSASAWSGRSRCSSPGRHLILPAPELEPLRAGGDPAASGAEGDAGDRGLERPDEVGARPAVEAVEARERDGPRARAEGEPGPVLVHVGRGELGEPQGHRLLGVPTPDRGAGGGEPDHVAARGAQP